MELNREFALLAQCCRWNFAGDRAQLGLSEPVDWQHFLRLARFHRVEGLAWRALGGRKECPADVAQALSADAARIAATSLEAAAESRGLKDAFDAAGMGLLFVKGVTLAVLAYGEIGSKSAIDIDLLVDPCELRRAAELLQRLGYRVAVPAAAGPAALERWHRRRKESVWTKPGSAIAVDLHTRLADNPRLLEGVDLSAARQAVEVAAGVVLPTLAADDLFAYLAVHGASSAWFRLKWLSDFAALASRLEPSDIDRIFRHADRIGAGRAAGQALLLAGTVFGTHSAARELREQLLRNVAVRRLYRSALRQFARPEPVEPTATPFGTVRIHWTQFLLEPGMRSKWSELVRQLRAIG